MKTIPFETSEYVVYEAYKGLHVAYHAKKFLYSNRSKYQKIEIIDNDAYGIMLFLDGNVQHSEYDAEIFNEALCRPILHADLKNVLVLGGGSGQTTKELLKSPSIQQIVMVEIDSDVVEASKQFIPEMKETLTSPRLEIIIGDAYEFLRNTSRQFDAVVLDLTESPFMIGDKQEPLEKLYDRVKSKCSGRCTQYIGSMVNLTKGPETKAQIEQVGPGVLKNVVFTEVFIPSFGAPHWIMHAGF